eukprot:scaffold287725_cov28-Tisochrysis_lutea.AAC.2
MDGLVGRQPPWSMGTSSQGRALRSAAPVPVLDGDVPREMGESEPRRPFDVLDRDLLNTAGGNGSKECAKDDATE